MSDLRKDIEKRYLQVISDSDRHNEGYNHALSDVLTLPSLQATIEKAEKWDCAMAQTNYCDDCKAPLLEEEIRRLTYNGSEEKAEKVRQLINYWQERALTAEGKYDKVSEGETRQ